MATILPVDVLDANIIQLNAKPLIDVNGDLSFNGKVLAKREELLSTHFVGNIAERDLLSPKNGDICKVTSTGQTFIFNTTWIDMYREAVSVFNVSSIIDRDLLTPIIHDMANVLEEEQSYLWSGVEWIELFAGNSILKIIKDAVTASDSTWSSAKIDFLISNHDHDGGSY